VKKKLAIGVVAVASMFGVAACGGEDESREDAADTRNVDRTAPAVIAFNNHYPNVEHKCDGFGHRVFVQTHDSAKGQNVTVLPDPTCPGYVKGEEPEVVVAP
jgi:ABC-type glycerol-3-phosphate transport system substrate-binding protein